MTDPAPIRYTAGRAQHAEFDESTHTWILDGQRARVLIATDGALPGDFSHPDPYLGVAVHGVPNYFLLAGPDAAAQRRYITSCLDHLSRAGATRIEVRATTQRRYNASAHPRVSRGRRFWRRVRTKIPSAFEVRPAPGTEDVDDDAFDGFCTVDLDGTALPMRARLAGSLNPIDGRFHWQGMVFDLEAAISPTERLPRDVTVTIDGRTAPARLTERTAQGPLAICGVGLPPFAMAELNAGAPLR